MYEFYDNMYIGNISTVETKLIDLKNVKKFFFPFYSKYKWGGEMDLCFILWRARDNFKNGWNNFFGNIIRLYKSIMSLLLLYMNKMSNQKSSFYCVLKLPYVYINCDRVP